MLWRITKQVLEEEMGVLVVVAILNRVVNIGLIEKEIFYEILEWVKEVSN